MVLSKDCAASKGTARNQRCSVSRYAFLTLQTRPAGKADCFNLMCVPPPLF